jgi:hypothetical protein
MDLEPGLTFGIAARFHVDANWSVRLRLNGGVTRRGAAILPRGDWRAPAAHELRILLGSDDAVATPAIQVLAISTQLRQRWWDLAAADAVNETPAGYEGFVGEVLELMRFKRLPVPPRCAAVVVASRPDQESTRLDRSGAQIAGLAFGSLAASQAHGAPQAVINLGDERGFVVLLNLGGAALRAQCGENDGASDQQVLDAFVTRQPTYPLVRVQLSPGEGLWFPSPAPAFDGWTMGKTDLDALLVLHAP